MEQRPASNGEKHHRPPSCECDGALTGKQHSNGYITPDKNRTLLKSSSREGLDPLSAHTPLSEASQSDDDLPSFPGGSGGVGGRISSKEDFLDRRLTDLSSPPYRQGVMSSDVTNEAEDWSDHTLEESSDSARTVKTEICLRHGKPELRKTVRSWPAAGTLSSDTLKSVFSISSTASSVTPTSREALPTSADKKKRVRMKDVHEEHAEDVPPAGSHKDSDVPAKVRSTSSKIAHPKEGGNAAALPREKETGSVTSAEQQHAPTFRQPRKPTEKDVALKLPPGTVQAPTDRQIMPKSPSSGLTTPSENKSDVTSPIQEAKKFLKGGTRAILIQKDDSEADPASLRTDNSRILLLHDHQELRNVMEGERTRT